MDSDRFAIFKRNVFHYFSIIEENFLQTKGEEDNNKFNGNFLKLFADRNKWISTESSVSYFLFVIINLFNFEITPVNYFPPPWRSSKKYSLSIFNIPNIQWLFNDYTQG